MTPPAQALRALVVGGTNGIGRGIACALSEQNVSVTIAGRDEARGNEVVQDLLKRGGKDHDFIRCDASKLKNVPAFAEGFLSRHPTLDLLILTQGRASLEAFTDNGEGIDIKLALHYYSRMAFIEALLPALRRSSAPRVLSVLSGGVHSPYAEYKEDPGLHRGFTLKKAADAAGFYNDLTLDTYSRDPLNANVLFAHAAPGVVNTSWGTEMPWAVRMVIRGLQPILGRSPIRCGRLLSAPLLAPDARPGFHLLNQDGRDISQKITKLHTDEARAAVWQHTREVFAAAGVKGVGS